jgi:hypothetical protein
MLMWPSFSVITGALSAAVAPTGTFTASVPSGKNAGSFFLALGHKLVVGSDVYFFPVDFDMSISGSTITITNKISAITWPQSATFRLQLNELGERAQLDVPMEDPNSQTGSITGSSYSINVRAKLIPSTTATYADLINLGAPATLDVDGITTSQSLAVAGTLSINGALASNGTVTLDVPRAVQVLSSATDTAVLTVNGADVYGQSMSEAITLNSATPVLGKKAFKTITRITSGAAIANLVIVGTTDVLGLPIFLPSAGFILREMEDGLAPAAGTVVAGIRTAGGSTTTTGDVRGTYDPNSACNGAKVFQLVVAVPNRSVGIAQNLAS